MNDCSLLRNVLACKEVVLLRLVKEQIESPGFLIPPHTLANFKIQKCYQNEPKFNGVYSRNNLPKVNNWTYVINLVNYKLIGTH